MSTKMTKKDFELLAQWAGGELATGNLTPAGVKSLAMTLGTTNDQFRASLFMDAVDRHAEFVRGFNAA